MVVALDQTFTPESLMRLVALPSERCIRLFLFRTMSFNWRSYSDQEKQKFLDHHNWKHSLKQRSYEAKGMKERFAIIREYYAKELPMLTEGIERGFVPNPYFLEWKWTQIEYNVWQDIRGLGLPFYPQIPVLNFFIDFGDPYHKIGIEADGKAWHDPELDKARDAKLAKVGWTIYRFTGAETYKKQDHESSEEWDWQTEGYVQRKPAYDLSSSEGFLMKLRDDIYFPHWEQVRGNKMIDFDTDEDF